MPVDSLCQSLHGAQWGRLDSAPQSLGLQLGRLKWLGQESSGGLSAHISGAWAGMTQRLAQLGLSTAVLIHVARAFHTVRLGSKTENPESQHRTPTDGALNTQREQPRMALYGLPQPPGVTSTYSTGQSSPGPTQICGRGTQTPPLDGRSIREFTAIYKNTMLCVAMPNGSAGWIWPECCWQHL